MKIVDDFEEAVRRLANEHLVGRDWIDREYAAARKKLIEVITSGGVRWNDNPDWPALVARVEAGESVIDVARSEGVDGRALRIRSDRAMRDATRESLVKRHKDPTFAAARDERMRKINADPAFKAAKAQRGGDRFRKMMADPEHNPLVMMTPQERADYDRLRPIYLRKGALEVMNLTVEELIERAKK